MTMHMIHIHSKFNNISDVPVLKILITLKNFAASQTMYLCFFRINENTTFNKYQKKINYMINHIELYMNEQSKH